MSSFKDRAGEPIKARVEIPKERVIDKLLKLLRIDDYADYPKRPKHPNF